MSSDVVIGVDGVSKCYQVYDQPRDRLKQFIIPKLRDLCGKPSKNYYRDFWALRDISFEVKKGESVGIIGRNGSGKSTLLQIITGTLMPTSGSVYTQGRIAALLELGSGFNPEFTGRENVYLNASLLGLNKKQTDARFDAIASFADIGDHLDQPVKTYSSGMVVRLAFAVQVQVEPEILIIDEALAVGDWLFQKRCFQQLEKLTSNGTTLLFVSHDQESVRTLTNRSLLLDRGKSKSWGVSSEVVLEYRKLLHEEESAYFSTQIPASDKSTKVEHQSAASDEINQSLRSEQLSFGEGEARVFSVKVMNLSGEEASIFYPGDFLRIQVVCQVLENVEKLNVGIRLRNREGVKIYSWGTLNQDMKHLNCSDGASVFWNQKHKSGDFVTVSFDCECPLGMNLYEIQASVSVEETPDYLTQRILHWVDEAAFFQVLLNRQNHFFGGVIDLKMNASW